MKTDKKNIRCFFGFKIHYILLVTLSLFLFLSFTQPGSDYFVKVINSRDTLEPPPRKDEIFKKVEIMPRFYHQECEKLASNDLKEWCSKERLLEFIYSNIQYPKEAKEAEVEGNTVVQFIVRKNGEVSDIKIAREIGYGCGAEAARVIQLMNDENWMWKPGIHLGQYVDVLYTLPIRFKLK